jgi:hypothetical protein
MSLSKPACTDCKKSGVSLIACQKPPHAPEFCLAKRCIPCHEIFDKNATYCTGRRVVCYVNYSKKCGNSEQMAITCACGRKVCHKCFPIDAFVKDGKCLICLEQVKMQEVAGDAEDAEPAAKRIKQVATRIKREDSNGERRD